MALSKLAQGGIAVIDGIVGGAVDQVGADQDAKNMATAAAAGKTQPLLKQFGTYVNYVVPALEVIGVAYMGWKGKGMGPLSGALLAQAGQLASRKVAYNLAKKHYVLTYVPAPATWTAEMAAQEAARRAAREAAHQTLIPDVIGGRLYR